MNKSLLKKLLYEATKEKVLMYNGKGTYTFIGATMWECIKFWMMTKFTGTDSD